MIVMVIINLNRIKADKKKKKLFFFLKKNTSSNI
jgi:hypothetical protein